MLKELILNRQFGRASQLQPFGIAPKEAMVLGRMKRLIFSTTEFFYQGTPLVRQYFAVQDQTMATKEHVLQLAASLANSSNKLGLRAVVRAAEEVGQPIREVEADAISPLGVTAKLDRSWYIFGDEDAMNLEEIELGVSIQTLMRQFEREGKYTLFLAQRSPKRLLGIFACEYQLVPEGKKVITQLEQLGLEIILLSEAKTTFVKHVGHELGISLVHSELSPSEKQHIIDDLVHQQAAPGVVVGPQSKLKAPLKIVHGSSTGLHVHSLKELPELIEGSQQFIKGAQKLIFWAKI